MKRENNNKFGVRLYTLRRKAGLTQAQLCELLEKVDDRLHYHPSRVSNWEWGKEIIDHTNRKLLVGFIKVLYENGGIDNIEEANCWLEGGKYSKLTDVEIAQIGFKYEGMPSNQYNEIEVIQANNMKEEDDQGSIIIKIPIRASNTRELIRQLLGLLS